MSKKQKQIKKCESCVSFKAVDNIEVITKGKCINRHTHRNIVGSQQKSCDNYIPSWNVFVRLERWIESKVLNADK